MQLPFSLRAQKDTLSGEPLGWHQRKAVKVVGIPLAISLLGTSMLLAEQHTDWNKHSLQEEFLEHRTGERGFEIEDHFRNAPVVLVYSLDLLGVEAQNSRVERSLILAKGLALQGLLVSQLKRNIYMERPDGGLRSFPSAHTAKAFATASFMQHEYGAISPWYTVAGYSFAVATGALRLINNHHWWPDVLYGAGIGMLSMNLAYATHRYAFTRWMHRKGSRSEMLLLPQAYPQGGGLSLQLWY